MQPDSLQSNTQNKKPKDTLYGVLHETESNKAHHQSITSDAREKVDHIISSPETTYREIQRIYEEIIFYSKPFNKCYQISFHHYINGYVATEIFLLSVNDPKVVPPRLYSEKEISNILKKIQFLRKILTQIKKGPDFNDEHLRILQQLFESRNKYNLEAQRIVDVMIHGIKTFQ